MSMKVPDGGQVPHGLGAYGTDKIGAPPVPVGKKQVETDTYKYKSINLLPDFIKDFKKDSLGMQCLKSVFFAATLPLLPFFMVGHAAAVVYLNVRNPEKLQDLNKLINKKKAAEHELALQKSVYTDSFIAAKEYPPAKIKEIRKEYEGKVMPQALEYKLKASEGAAYIRASWPDTRNELKAKIEEFDTQIASLKSSLGIKEK